MKIGKLKVEFKAFTKHLEEISFEEADLQSPKTLEISQCGEVFLNNTIVPFVDYVPKDFNKLTESMIWSYPTSISVVESILFWEYVSLSQQFRSFDYFDFLEPQWFNDFDKSIVDRLQFIEAYCYHPHIVKKLISEFLKHQFRGRPMHFPGKDNSSCSLCSKKSLEIIREPKNTISIVKKRRKLNFERD